MISNDPVSRSEDSKLTELCHPSGILILGDHLLCVQRLARHPGDPLGWGWAKSDHAHLLLNHRVYQLLSTTAELSICNRARTACQQETVYSLALYRKNLPTPAV